MNQILRLIWLKFAFVQFQVTGPDFLLHWILLCLIGCTTSILVHTGSGQLIIPVKRDLLTFAFSKMNANQPTMTGFTFFVPSNSFVLSLICTPLLSCFPWAKPYQQCTKCIQHIPHFSTTSAAYVYTSSWKSICPCLGTSLHSGRVQTWLVIQHPRPPRSYHRIRAFSATCCILITLACWSCPIISHQISSSSTSPSTRSHFWPNRFDLLYDVRSF